MNTVKIADFEMGAGNPLVLMAGPAFISEKPSVILHSVWVFRIFLRPPLIKPIVLRSMGSVVRALKKASRCWLKSKRSWVFLL